MNDERDPKLQSAYRALGAEEPPRALDQAILAAAARYPLAGGRPVQPWTRRWAVPLSLAAVVVLSVVVTLRIQHEQPGIEQLAPVRKEEQVARQAVEPAVRAPQQKSMARKEAQAFPPAEQDRAVAENRAAEAAPAPPAAAVAPAPRMEAPALAKRADAPSEVGSAAGSGVAPSAPAAAAPAMRAMQRDRVAAERSVGERLALTPEQELERIAGLRKLEKHDEADKALAEFRKRYPEFKIPPAMLERVERR